MYRSYRREREADIKRAIGGWIVKTCMGIKLLARRNAPKGASNDLVKSIEYGFKYPLGTVSVNVPYARFVEGYPRITRRHFTPWDVSEMFTRWGRQRGFDTSRGGLLTWGYKVPYFRNAIRDITPRAMAQLRSLHL